MPVQHIHLGGSEAVYSAQNVLDIQKIPASVDEQAAVRKDWLVTYGRRVQDHELARAVHREARGY